MSDSDDASSTVQTWGYVGPSTPGMDTDQEMSVLIAAGVDPGKVLSDASSTERQNRPELERLIAVIRPSDALIVWRLDRLAVSLPHVIRLLDRLGRHGVRIVSISEAIDTALPSGQLLTHIAGALTALDDELRAESTAARRARAEATGIPLGRPSLITQEQYDTARAMHAGGASRAVIAKATGLSLRTTGRLVKGQLPGVEMRYGGKKPT